MNATRLRDRSVLVMGLGRFGGGIGVTRWLCAQGARVTVTDLADRSALAGPLARLGDCEVKLSLGQHREADLDGVELVVVNPAVDRRRSDFFARVRQRRIPWTTEINLFLQSCPARVIGVTGTTGKSTTCALLHEALGGAADGDGRVWLGGNLGRSLLEELPRMSPGDLVVLELSSFQLEATPLIATSPELALITNLRPNHLDRHGDFDAYLDAKLNLFRFQRAGCPAVVGPGDNTLARQVGAVTRQTAATLVRVEPPGEPYALRLPGRHNQENAACAATVARLLGVTDALARKRMAGFGGLPHRLEHVLRVAGADYYNDSKSTTPAGVATALAAFDRPVVLIVGGQDRGEDLRPLLGALGAGCRALVCTGGSGERLAGELAARPAVGGPAVTRAADLAQAVKQAHRAARAGDVVVLSPGAPSYDRFVNYEQRGEAFRRLVADLAGRQ